MLFYKPNYTRGVLKRTQSLKEMSRQGKIYLWRQCGPVFRALALRSGDPGFKTRSNHSLNLILVVPGSTSQLHL